MTEYTVHVLYNNEITAPSNNKHKKYKKIKLYILEEQRCTKLSLRADPCRYYLLTSLIIYIHHQFQTLYHHYVT